MCKGLGEGTVMEKAAEMEATAAGGGRKRKVYLGESGLSTSSGQLKTRRLDDVTPEKSGNSSSCETDNTVASCSCCSSNRSSELTKGASKFADLEDNNEATVEFFATSAGDSFGCRRETTPLREAEAESGELESTARPREPNPRHSSIAEKIPSDAELEEFFAAAENKLQKKFTDKYNYDIVKDQPLEGRYEWIQVELEP